MRESDPQLQRAWNAVAPLLDNALTSVKSGPHDPNGAHPIGKAFDVAPAWVGDNKKTWNAIAHLTNMKLFDRIGMYPPLYEKALKGGLVKWAASRGVNLFSDRGTAPHLHLQVP